MFTKYCNRSNNDALCKPRCGNAFNPVATWTSDVTHMSDHISDPRSGYSAHAFGELDNLLPSQFGVYIIPSQF